MRALTSAAERHRYDRDLLIALATFHREQGDLAEAIAYASRLTELAPDGPGARELLAELTASR